MTEASPAFALVERMVRSIGRDATRETLRLLRSEIPIVDMAGLAHCWRFWARPKQLAPASSWRSWGFLTGRGFGKTLAAANHIVTEIQAGRIRLMGMAAQNEAKTYAVQVEGLIGASPSWFRPRWESAKMELVFPNGARARAFTPEAPEAIRSDNYDACWMSEIQSWPKATQEEAYLNFKFCTRVGYAHTIWDATPKRRHPIIKRLLERSARNPGKHIVVRGSMYENALNLNAEVIGDLENEYGGTQKGREELLGEMLSESDSALVKEEWISKNRRPAPDIIIRRVIAIDPAVTNRAGNDRTGIVDDALGADGQVYVMGDYSDKHSAEAWPRIVVERYVAGRCDCCVVETNKGGDLVTQNLRAHASMRGLTVVVLGKEETPRHTPGIIYVREVHARGAKEDRAQPLATAYERGRISHVIGANLVALEDTLTTWEPMPGVRSPDALDAHVHGVVELLGLAANHTDAKVGFAGITQIAAALQPQASRSQNLAALIGGGRGAGGRI